MFPLVALAQFTISFLASYALSYYFTVNLFNVLDKFEE